MVKKLKKSIRKALGRERPAARVPEEMQVYAIGDVHGHLDELDQLLAHIDEDRESGLETHLVLLGDYIDRGPDSRGVVERLMDGVLDDATVTCLMGNHERVLLDIVDDGAPSGPSWLRYGGYELLESYGLERKELLRRKRPLRQSILEVLPDDHLRFLRSLPVSHEVGDYFFAHAGVRPGVPLHAQKSRDLMWIREGFVDSKRDHGKVVVHGHTIEDGPVDRPNRIGLDTGCYAGTALSAVRLRADTRHFISVKSAGATWKRG